MAIHPIWNTYPTLKKDLEATQQVMERAVTIRNTDITKALHAFFSSGGKLLRPAYFLLFTYFGDVPSEHRKHQYAASIETLHTATLIHDDIIDDSPIRRDRPSIQAAYGKDIAVYTGDFLFTVYFQLIAAGSQDISALENSATNMQKILIGELDQMNLRNNPQITIKQYLQHIKGKTAQLFQLSCYEGARFAKTSKRVQILGQRIGYNIGMAFQILDDILDYAGNEETLHKPILEDLRNGNYTLPLIFAMEKNRDAFQLLEKGAALSDDEIQTIVQHVFDYGGIEEAKRLAERYTKKALENIAKLPDNPAKDVLNTITKELLDRSE